MAQVFRYVSCALALAVLLASPGCGVDFSTEYAIARLDLPDGRSLYFKRQVHGLNGDYNVVVISQNGDPCAGFNPDADYCICHWSPVYYKLEGDTLHLYFGTANHAPTKQAFPVKVVNHEIPPVDEEYFKRKYAEMGITHLDLTVDGTKKCS